MRYNVITYLLGEGIRNVFKNKKSTSASIIIMSLTMLIFGVFFVITQNINSIMKQIESEQGIEVFLYDISEDQTKALEDYIRNIDGINTVEYKSKEDALNQLKSQFKDREDLLSGYDENNIFPASYVVTLTDLTKNNEVKQKIDEYDKDKPDTEKVIKKITSSDETITTLINLANGIRIITGVILVILIIISIFIISNTIKLTVHARRKEISIMKYVGATNSFIRWPFIVEGIIIGIISGKMRFLIMRIALINENSQAAKNDLIYSNLKKVAESKGHTVDNYGMYSADDKAQLTYVQNGILAAILLNSGACDFVVTGCGTGEGAMLALNSFPNVLCGHVVDPSDAYMFMQINDGNAIALPFAKGFGWGAELNLTYIFEKLFEGEPGGGYPKERVVPEQRNKKILDEVRKVAFKDSLIDILKNLDQDLVKGAVAGEKFQELFFANCKDEKIAEYVKTLLA